MYALSLPSRMEAFLLHDVGHDGRVDGAAAGAHDHAVKRREAHGGVDALAALDRGDGRAVADVAGDDLRLLEGLVQQLRHFAGHEPVRGAVRAVAADVVLLVHIPGNAVHVGLRRHGLVERGVEDEDLRLVGHDGEAALDAHDVRAGVKGSEVAAELELIENLVAQKDGLEEVGTAVHDTVADALDLVHVGDDAELGIGEVLDDDLGGHGVILHGDLDLVLLAVLSLAVLDAAVDADALADALGEDGFGGGIEELVLQGRRTGVHNQNFHRGISSGKVKND